jgi:hypothetical protein
MEHAFSWVAVADRLLREVIDGHGRLRYPGANPG